MTWGPVSTHSPPPAGLVPQGSVLLASLPPWSMYIRPTAPAGGSLWAIHACAHFRPLASMHIGSRPGVCGLSGMQVQPLLPWRSVFIEPSACGWMIVALADTDDGAAAIAFANGSFESGFDFSPALASVLA